MEISSSSKPYISSEEKERKSYLERLIHRFSRRRRRRQEADDQAQAYAEFTQERARQRERIEQQRREKEAYEIWEQENPEQVRLNQIAINKEKKARQQEKARAAEERHNQYQWVRQVGGGWIMEKIPPPLSKYQQWEKDNLYPWEIREIEQSRRNQRPRSYKSIY